jgi:hypothetical protein
MWIVTHMSIWPSTAGMAVSCSPAALASCWSVSPAVSPDALLMPMVLRWQWLPPLDLQAQKCKHSQLTCVSRCTLASNALLMPLVLRWQWLLPLDLHRKMASTNSAKPNSLNDALLMPIVLRWQWLPPLDLQAYATDQCGDMSRRVWF